MDDTDFSMTTGALARAAGLTVLTVRLYAELGLLPYRRASNGMRLFNSAAPARAQEILRERLARRGGAHRDGKRQPA